MVPPVIYEKSTASIPEGLWVVGRQVEDGKEDVTIRTPYTTGPKQTGLEGPTCVQGGPPSVLDTTYLFTRTKVVSYRHTETLTRNKRTPKPKGCTIVLRSNPTRCRRGMV